MERKNCRRIGGIRVLLGVAVAAALNAPVFADPIGADAGLILRLSGDATFQEGCFPPCLCPLLVEQPVLGTLKLVYMGQPEGVHLYEVQEVNGLLPYSDTTERIVGSGRYSVGSPSMLTVMEQRLELDLRIGEGAVQHFDSGWRPWNPGDLDLTVSINGEFCWDRVIRVHAAAVPASELRPYALDAGAAFQRGCIDGMCDCAVGPELPMRGGFALVPLSSNPLFELFAVVDARWLVFSTNVSDGMPVQGAGLYWVGGEVAVQNRLVLEMSVAGEPPQPYDSGMVIGGGGFPNIDIVTRTHTNCLDTVLHVVASPSQVADTCGGIAGFPCDAGQFCRLPPGHCCCDFQGTCVIPPQACPLYIDPVCGCDQVTYSNPCFADMAGASIDHWGACRSGCGRPNDPPCPNASFCKFAPGACGPTPEGGFCTPRPTACPDVWLPVCGCDGTTYGNECDADAAGVSVRHPGECDDGKCSATRVLDHPSDYCGGVAGMVTINLNPPDSASAMALEDAPPPGWSAEGVSDGGFFDVANQKVKWGPFFPPFPPTVSYLAVPPPQRDETQCFAGTVSINGLNSPICGEDCLAACCPRMEADLPHGGCPSCPVADCNSCDASVCGDNRIHVCEVVGYACAWLRGCQDDLAGMTRAAYVWRNGECYCWDDATGQWNASDCTSDATGCCPGSGGPASVSPLVGDAVIVIEAEPESATHQRFTRQIWVDVEVPAGAAAVALEVDVPAGWEVASISDGGAWDAARRKVKWGPFFDDTSRTVGFEVSGLAKGVPLRSRTSRGGPAIRWTGTLSIDGVNQTIHAR